jgi:DNA-binding LytR/AlgR family response regulator
MLNTIIIEDEEPARQQLLYTLSQLSVEVQVNGMFNTVKDSIQYLSSPVDADIIFSDVQLTDGLSFEIFSHTRVRIPVIFITGYDEFVMNAFEYNGIDYLLKPVTKPELEKALEKYRMLEKHFAGNQNAVSNLTKYIQGRKRSRLVVRRGLENIVLRLEDIVFFYTENKIVFVVDNAGRKYMADKNLGDLESELDTSIFFRANRQYIININYVKGYKAYEKVKLQVDLTVPDLNCLIVISQETAPMFRKWMYEA